MNFEIASQLQKRYDARMQVATATAPSPSRPTARPSGYVCDCLEVTECALLETLSSPHVRTLRDVRRAIGAGDGCTACHDLLRQYLEAARQQPAARQPSCPPICSAR